MNILCATDGSDDGYEAATTLAKIIDARLVCTIRVVLIVWPQRGTPLWDKAYEAWVSEDRDLQQSVERTIVREITRFENAFKEHAASVETAGVNGDPLDTLLHNAQDIDAGLIVLAVTNDDRVQPVRNLCEDIVARSRAPVVVAHGAHVVQGGEDA